MSDKDKKVVIHEHGYRPPKPPLPKKPDEAPPKKEK